MMWGKQLWTFRGRAVQAEEQPVQRCRVGNKLVHLPPKGKPGGRRRGGSGRGWSGRCDQISPQGSMDTKENLDGTRSSGKQWEVYVV